MSQIVKRHPAQTENPSLAWIEPQDPHAGNATFQSSLNSMLVNEANFVVSSTYDLDKISTTEQAMFFKEKYGINDPDYLKVLDRVCVGNPTFQDCGMLLGYCHAFPNDASCLVQGPIWNWKPWMIFVVILICFSIGVTIRAGKSKKKVY